MKKVIVIVGPTASGKSDLSVKLAQYLNTEIISGDSVQVYRSLDIGSGKITKDEMQGIKHHLIDILDPDEDYSVATFQKNARRCIDEIASSGHIPILCGGTGFYLKAALYDYDFTNVSRTNEFEFLTNEELFNKLNELGDKEIPDVNDRKRLLRHMELFSSNLEMKYGKNDPLYDILFISLTMPRDVLYERINNRVDQMVKSGLIDEVKSLYDKGIKSNSVRAIGYKELYSYFDGEISLDDAIDLIKKNSRHFAKRQYTWLNNQIHPIYIDITKEDPLEKSKTLIDEFIKKAD